LLKKTQHFIIVQNSNHLSTWTHYNLYCMQ